MMTRSATGTFSWPGTTQPTLAGSTPSGSAGSARCCGGTRIPTTRPPRDATSRPGIRRRTRCFRSTGTCSRRRQLRSGRTPGSCWNAHPFLACRPKTLPGGGAPGYGARLADPRRGVPRIRAAAAPAFRQRSSLRHDRRRRALPARGQGDQGRRHARAHPPRQAAGERPTRAAAPDALAGRRPAAGGHAQSAAEAVRDVPDRLQRGAAARGPRRRDALGLLRALAAALGRRAARARDRRGRDPRGEEQRPDPLARPPRLRQRGAGARGGRPRRDRRRPLGGALRPDPARLHRALRRPAEAATQSG